MVPLYQLTPRAYLAILLNKIDLNTFVEKAQEDSIISALMAIASILKIFDPQFSSSDSTRRKGNLRRQCCRNLGSTNQIMS